MISIMISIIIYKNLICKTLPKNKKKFCVDFLVSAYQYGPFLELKLIYKNKLLFIYYNYILLYIFKLK